MKKIIALLMSVICLVTCMGIPVSAFEDIPGNIGGNMVLSPTSPLSTVSYMKLKPLTVFQFSISPAPPSHSHHPVHTP